MNKEEQLKERLRAAGERVTTPRLALFRILMRHSPVPMPKLLDRAREDGLDTVTVYRTLDLFRKLALVQDAGLGRNRLLELGDDYQAHHHHLTCSDCGKLFDFDSLAIEADLRAAGEKLGFSISSHQLEATGLCAVCRARGLSV